MTARVLVVDDILANVKLLEARLQAEYFEVLTAYSGQDAIEACRRERVDVVLLDVMMPGMDGFEVCRRLKADSKTCDIPIVMVTALDQTSDKLQGLDAGADDFLTKPVDDIALMTRVKNLTRLKTLNDEMNMRASTILQLGLDGDAKGVRPEDEAPGRVLIVDDHPRWAERLARTLTHHHNVAVESDPEQALLTLGREDFDLAIVSLSLSQSDGLRLCGQLRSLDRMRSLPIVIVVGPDDDARLLRGMDMGVNDYIKRPVDENELLARVRTQIRRKRYSDYLRGRLEDSIQLAIMDDLTGLHNRRYLEAHLSGVVQQAVETDAPLALLMVDIDHFKRINDTYGHDVGDLVLEEFARRFRVNTRSVDLACRLGGEEFVLVMPGVDKITAWDIAERLRLSISQQPFYVSDDLSVPITISVGMTTVEHAEDTPEVLLKRADNALYDAKRDGRNRVVTDAATSAA